MGQTPDPWYDALDRWTTQDLGALTQPLDGALPGHGDTPPGPQRRTFALTTPRIIAISAVAAILLGAAGTGGVLTYKNRQRAAEWRDRSVVLQDLVAQRTSALNRQTARLNVASTTLRKAQASITRSEQDVTQLERRQRELANEKAQIEDERAQLLVVANSLEGCNTGLRDVINAIGSGVDLSTLNLDQISQTCRQADSAVQTYLGVFGN